MFQRIKQEADQLKNLVFLMKNNINEIYSQNNGLNGWMDGWMDGFLSE